MPNSLSVFSGDTRALRTAIPGVKQLSRCPLLSCPSEATVTFSGVVAPTPCTRFRCRHESAPLGCAVDNIQDVDGTPAVDINSTFVVPVQWEFGEECNGDLCSDPHDCLTNCGDEPAYARVKYAIHLRFVVGSYMAVYVVLLFTPDEYPDPLCCCPVWCGFFQQCPPDFPPPSSCWRCPHQCKQVAVFAGLTYGSAPYVINNVISCKDPDHNDYVIGGTALVDF